jgi:hypothetical protein
MIYLLKKMTFLILLFSTTLYSQEKVIFDTDFGADADDLAALVMLHTYINSGECELLGVMSWSNEKFAVPAIDAVNRYYGNPDIPISIRSHDLNYIDWNYNEVIASNFHYEKTAEEVPLSKDLYRKILAEQPDQSVTIITVGPLKNIQNLINSEPDKYSELSGEELIDQKVKRFVIMGGKFPAGKEEWNFDGGMPGVTKYVIEKIQRPIIFSGYEIGVKIKTGAMLEGLDLNDPLILGYKHFSENAPWMQPYYEGGIINNSSYDQTAVLYAIERNKDNLWKYGENGYCKVNEKGDSEWIPGQKSNQSYLILNKDPELVARIIEKRMLGKRH